jgi:hypothetical protein
VEFAFGAGVLHYAAHATGGEGVAEFPEGGAVEVQACEEEVLDVEENSIRIESWESGNEKRSLRGRTYQLGSVSAMAI